jgi:hypothetical protein
MQRESLAKTDLWPEYRRAFEEFSQKVRRIQSLTPPANPDAEALFTAALELEEARMMYNCRRDALARQLLPSRPGDAPQSTSI